MALLEERLVSHGFSARFDGALVAKSKEGSLHIDPSGICWAAFDPADAVLPAVPEILDMPKEAVPSRSLASMYFKFGPRGSRTTVRISTRIESYSHWDELRVSGGCGLAPDEHAVATFLLKRADTCEILTDFPTDKSKVRVRGRTLYYESEVDCAEAAETLRAVGSKAPRNSYLYRDGLLRLRGLSMPTPREWLRLFCELGDWCCFAPEQQKALIADSSGPLQPR